VRVSRLQSNEIDGGEGRGGDCVLQGLGLGRKVRVEHGERRMGEGGE